MDKKILKSPCARLLPLLGIAVFLAYVCWTFIRPVETEDIWWHLATGRWIAAHGEYPSVDVFSPKSVPSEWVLTQATGSLLFYKIFALGGLEGLIAFRALFFAFVTGLILLRADKKIPMPWLITLLTVAVLDVLEARHHLRPYIFNLLFIQLYLIVLSARREGAGRYAVFLLPLLSAAWFNLHLGAFVYGSLIIGIFLGCSLLEAAQKKTAPGSGPRVYLLALAGHALGFLANPYGIAGALYPFKAFFDTNFVVKNLIMHSITELRPPCHIFSLEGWRYLIIFTLAVFALWKTKENQLRNTLLFVTGTGLFLYAQRAVDFWALASLYVMIDAAAQNRLFECWQQWPRKKALAAALAVLCAAVMDAEVYGDWKKETYRLGKLEREKCQLTDNLNPAEPLWMLQASGLTATVFNWDGYGGYLLWAGHPGIKPLADGRQADPELYADYLRVVFDPKRFWPEKEAQYGITLALLNGGHGSNHALIDYLIARPDWQLISVSGNAVLLVKQGAHVLPEGWATFEEKARNRPVTPDDLIPAEIDGSLTAVEEIDVMNEGIILFTSGFYGEGLKRLRTAWQATRSRKAAENLNLAIDTYRQTAASL